MLVVISGRAAAAAEAVGIRLSSPRSIRDGDSGGGAAALEGGAPDEDREGLSPDTAWRFFSYRSYLHKEEYERPWKRGMIKEE